MWKLGKWAILTHDELRGIKESERALGYQAGLRSKWRAKKQGEIESLLTSVADDVVLPQREAA